MRDVPPPLLSFVLYHRAMRLGAQRLSEVLDGEPDEELRAALTRWYEHYRTACLIHADGEDGVLWPGLLAERPDLSDAVTLMEGEHSGLASALDALRDALSDLARWDDARGSARLLASLVNGHLDHEEGDPLDAVIDTFSGDRLVDLVRAIQQSAGPEGSAIAVPFLLSEATDEERAAILAAMPPPVREAYESSWRSDYDALVAPLKG